MKPGTKPTPTSILKMRGTFRQPRHGERADVAPPPGQPIKPSDLGEVESALWNQVVPDLVRRKLVGTQDTAELTCLCELWGLYRKAIAAAKVDPIDKEIRCAVTGYFSAFDRLCAKFGLTSADLASLKVAPESEGKKSVQGRKRA